MDSSRWNRARLLVRLPRFCCMVIFSNRSFTCVPFIGDKLVCDSSLDWFITYLVKYNIRTFLPKQPEITCAAPPQFAGVRIKELMIKKANDTLTTSMQQMGIANTPQQRNNFLSNLLPALSGMGLATGGNAAGGNAPILGSLSQAIPSLRSIPGWNGIIPGTNSGDPAIKNLESAVEQVSIFKSSLSNYCF